MPSLPPEISLWPEDLFSQNGTSPIVLADERRWWALHTRPRAEKALARRLVQQETAFFLPLYERRRRVQRRLVVSQLPLFPSYLFLLGNEDERVKVLETNLIVGCLDVVDQDQLRTDLQRIRGLIETGAPLSPEERLQTGMAAKITNGPLTGYQGTVIRRGRSLKFFVAVNLLQRGVTVEVDASMIQPV